MLDSVIDVFSVLPATTADTKQILENIVASGAKSVMLLVCEDAPVLIAQELDSLLQRCPIPVFGAIFPKLILDDRVLSESIVACTFDTEVLIENFRDVSALTHFSEQSRQLSTSLGQSPLFLFVDSTIKNIDTALEELCAICGNDQQYFGGGAGFSSMTSQPCIVTNDGVVADCLQIASIRQMTLTAVVKHGWQLLAGPLLVTDSCNGYVKSLDYKPALEVYKNTLRSSLNDSIVDQLSVLELAVHHPFGIARLGHEVVVRDPYATEQDALICLGDVPADHFIYILKGSVDNILLASKDAAQELATSLSSRQSFEPFFMFDCISRMHFLNDKFTQELSGVLDELPKDVRLVGAITIGEIANTDFACLELLNKSAVIGYFSR